MRLCLLVVFFLYLGPVSSNVEIINGMDIERLYFKHLDRMIQALEDLVEKTDNPSQEDEDRISCIIGLNALLRNLGSSWGLAMIDSSSKLQSGILHWNFIDLGEYDQCLNVSVGPTEENPTLPTFTGRHCLITNNIYIPNGTIEVNGENFKLLDVVGHPYIPLTLAQCYPSLCKPYVIQEGLNGILSLLEDNLKILGFGFSHNITVDPKDCHVAKDTPYDVLDMAILIIILLFVLLGLIATALHCYFNRKPSSDTMNLLDSFSFYTNTKNLFSTRTAPDVIPSLNGLKFLSMCWIIFQHRYYFIPNEPLRNMDRIYATQDILKQLQKMIICNGPLAVDTFFFISGLLNMYGFLTVTTKSKSYTIKDVLKGYIHRYLRLTPAYLIMMGFTASWLYHLRDGPLWDRFVGVYKDQCRDHYWTNIFYLNNYIGPRSYCMMQSWYLAADMQLFWLSPIVMYPLWKWPKYGWMQLMLLIIASIISPFLVSWYGHIAAPIPMTSNLERKHWEYSVLYHPIHTRFGSYVQGIVAGHIIFHYRKGTLSLDINLRKRVIGWLLSASMMLYALFGGYKVFQLSLKYNQLFSAFYIGFQRFFWSAGLLWLVLMCVRGYGGSINSFLSWKVFTPLAKISYCTYLTHVVILMCSIGAQRNSFYYADYDLMELFLGDVVLSMLSGVVLSLLVEMPLLNVKKFVLGGGRKKPKDERKLSTSTPNKLLTNF